MPELFKVIATKINCTWRVIHSKDGLFGSKLDDGTWNGVIGMLANHELDLTLADLAVTSDRAKVCSILLQT